MSITSASSEEEVAKLSFKNASRLQKVNQILAQVIAYFTADPMRLESEGLLRVQGDETLVNPIVTQMLDDPLAKPLDAFDKIQNDPNDVIGVFKKMVKNPLGFSPDALKAIEMLFVEDKRLTSDGIMKTLIAMNALEEAKMLHNTLHFGFLVASNKEKNRMGLSNVAVVLGPWIANMTDNPMMGFNPVLKENLIRIIEQDKGKLAQSFDQAYPEQAKALNDGYQRTFPKLADVAKAQPEVVKKSSEKPSGNIFVRFFKAFWNGIKSIFSGGNKAENQEQELLISPPQNFRQVTPVVESKGTAVSKPQQIKAQLKEEAEVASHLVKREKPVAPHRKHHSEKEKVKDKENSQKLEKLLGSKNKDKPKQK